MQLKQNETVLAACAYAVYTYCILIQCLPTKMRYGSVTAPRAKRILYTCSESDPKRIIMTNFLGEFKKFI